MTESHCLIPRDFDDLVIFLLNVFSICEPVDGLLLRGMALVDL